LNIVLKFVRVAALKYRFSISQTIGYSMKKAALILAACVSLIGTPSLSDTKLTGAQVLDLLYGDKLAVRGGGCNKTTKSGYQWKWEKSGKVQRWKKKTVEIVSGPWHIDNKGRMCQDIDSDGKFHCDQYWVYGSNNSKLRYTHHESGKTYKPTRSTVAKYSAVSKCLF
jgi:hypothetical protein